MAKSAIMMVRTARVSYFGIDLFFSQVFGGMSDEREQKDIDEGYFGSADGGVVVRGTRGVRQKAVGRRFLQRYSVTGGIYPADCADAGK